MKVPKIFVLFVLVSIGTFAQKIKVKKGVVFIDKNESPIIIEEEEKENDTYYHFKDTSIDKDFVTVQYQFKNFNEENKFEWLVLAKEGVDFSNEVDMEYHSFTLNMKRSISEFLMRNLEFFDVNGKVNYSKIENFFSTKIERKSLEAYNKVKKETKDFQDKYNATASLRISVDPKTKEIFRGEDLIGTYRFSNPETIIIRDLDLVKVGTLTKEGVTQKNFVISSQLFADPIRYESSYRYGATDNFGTRDAVKEAVRHLHVKGYELGNSVKNDIAAANEGALEEAKLNYQEAKENSSNIYSKPGYVIDDKGKRYEGKIKAIFEGIKDPTDPLSNGTMVSVGGDGIGYKVRVEYINEKDKRKFKTFSAKKDNYFCVFDENNSEVRFDPVKVKSNGLLSTSGELPSIGGAPSNLKYMKRVLEGKGIIVYQQFPQKKYLIKTEKQSKAFDFEFGPLIKEEKKSAKLKEYLGGCNFKDGLYKEEDFLQLENVKNLVNFYETSCK